MISRFSDWLPRLALAAIFFVHGLDKFINLESFAAKTQLQPVVAYLVATAETLGAALIILGAMKGDFLTRLAGLFFMVVMLGAIFMVHWPNWSELQYPVLILAVSCHYFLKGNA